MEENKKGYDPMEYDNDDDFAPQQDDSKKSITGYRIVIIILSVILVALSLLYFSIHRQQMVDNELLQSDRDSIQSDLGRLMTDYDGLESLNDTITANLNIERSKADSLMGRLKSERSWNLSKIREYQSQVKLLRSIAETYVRQIDSLNTLNKKLITQNITFRKEISTAQLRAEVAEEKAAELDNKVRAGAVMKARDIRLFGLSKRGRDVSRIKRADRLRTDFVISANDLSVPGDKTIYMVITHPDSYILTTDEMPTFEFEGERATYTASRDVDYQNQDLEISIFYNSEGFVAGTYRIDLYCDGYLIGATQIVMK